MTGYLAPADRSEPDTARLTSLTETEQHALKLLADGMTGNWTLEGLTILLYGIPKLQRGLPLTAAPTTELKTARRAWFILLYQLFIDKDAGPRLPTLLMTLGQERIRSLLSLGAGG